MRVFHFVTVKRKRALRPNSFFFFFNDSHIFLKCFNSNHNLSSYSLFSKCFLWFFYLSVHRGTGVFWWCFFICLFSLLLSRVTRFRVRLKQTFFYNDINIQIGKFFSELVESKSCGKYYLITIRIGTNTALLCYSYSLFLKCFSWLFYLGVHRGTGVFSWFYFSLLLSRVTRSRARLALASV